MPREPCFTIPSRSGHRALIVPDDDPINPRHDYPHPCVMVCHHRRYSLGDKNTPKTPESLYRHLIGSDAYDALDARFDREYNALSATHSRSPTFKDEVRSLKEAHSSRLSDAIARAAPIFIPLGLYDHSGLSIYIGGGPHWCDSAGWDSGTVGYIYCLRSTILKEWGKGAKRLTKKMLASALRCAKAEVEEYDNYLTGQVYGIIIEGPPSDPEDPSSGRDELDSCWGFNGSLFPSTGERHSYVVREARQMLSCAIRRHRKETHNASARVHFSGAPSGAD